MTDKLVSKKIHSLRVSIQEKKTQWYRLLREVSDVFEYCDKELEKTRKLADEVRTLTRKIDSFIEGLSSKVCSQCKEVCCANRHSYPDRSDLVYLFALGKRPPAHDENLEEDKPCRFMSYSGCTVERAFRPFRCNWFFCDAFLAYLQENPGRTVRQFQKEMQRIIDLRMEMLDAFDTCSAKYHIGKY